MPLLSTSSVFRQKNKCARVIIHSNAFINFL
uniref:Uncharacterized protein n=1 Tax=Caudovirales sp. ct0YK8 TaxID=2826764 RepID=A0A8S5NQW2_9CAUD|nr:MAG TPA: hypothetical protein [Caudovirales sp. ct0YK8]